MTYNKPEVVKLASCIRAIQGSPSTKGELERIDSNPLDQRKVSFNAYEADE